MGGVSACNKLKSSVRVVRVQRIENCHLWRRYSTYRSQMLTEMRQHGVRPCSLDSVLPEVFEDFAMQFGGLDTSVAETFLFHGTSFETAVKVALEGFDFRLSRPGYYGHGT